MPQDQQNDRPTWAAWAEPPAWQAEAQPGELSIQEHADAIAMVAELRPFCTRWMVDLRHPEIASEVALIIMGDGVTPGWAIYRDDALVLHFEDLRADRSYIFGTMTAGLHFVRAVLDAAVVSVTETAPAGTWWQRLPGWLVADMGGQTRPASTSL